MNTSNRLEDEEGLPRKVRYLMFEAFATRHNRTRTAVWIAVCCILSAAAAIEGISDNLPGILLAFGAAIALVLAFVHPWRSAPKFRNLLFGSAAALVVSGLLHNVFDAVAGQVEGTALLQVPLQGLAVATLLIAILICPPRILVGLVGSVVMSIRNR